MKLNSSTLAALALVFWAVPAWGYGASGEEDRCTELGDKCLCGESFNTNQYANLGNQLFDPQNSTGPKQCTHYWAGGTNPPQDAIAESQLSAQGWGDRLPSGTDVDFVQRSGYASYSNILGDATGSGTRRMCMRHYFMRGSGAVIGGGNTKDMVFDIGGCQIIVGNGTRGNDLYFFDEPGSKCGVAPCDWGNSATYSNPACTGVGNLTQADCIGHWCRVEFCAYGALTGSGPVLAEGYIVKVGNPSVRRDYVGIAFGDVPGNGTGISQGNSPFWGYAGSMSSNPGKMISHNMQAAWSTDSPGTFIGPAREIEGGNGTTPPPPPAPTPTPPAAPVLLP